MISAVRLIPIPYFIFRAVWSILTCAQLSHPPNPERVETRSSPRRAHSYNAPSKLARYLFRDGG
jgi:hypothetical protein